MGRSYGDGKKELGEHSGGTAGRAWRGGGSEGRGSRDDSQEGWLEQPEGPRSTVRKEGSGKHSRKVNTRARFAESAIVSQVRGTRRAF